MNNNGYPPNLWQEQETEETLSLFVSRAASCTQCIFKKLGNCYISALFQKRVFTESSKCQALLF